MHRSATLHVLCISDWFRYYQSHRDFTSIILADKSQNFTFFFRKYINLLSCQSYV
uniref:Uncharacterized protein n=1 Tax=Anguilla anguilla TaxID=7936 RepID=A0A0E9XTD0_ANGAN